MGGRDDKKKKLTSDELAKLDLKGSQKHENVKKIISRATITTIKEIKSNRIISWNLISINWNPLSLLAPV